MSVDVFKRQLISAKKIYLGPAGIGFNLTLDGNLNIYNKRLCNVAPAIDLNVVNLDILNITATRLTINI